jgi:hypothetical protein
MAMGRGLPAVDVDDFPERIHDRTLPGLAQVVDRGGRVNIRPLRQLGDATLPQLRRQMRRIQLRTLGTLSGHQPTDPLPTILRPR